MYAHNLVHTHARAQAVKDFTAHVKKDSRSFVTMLPVRDGITIIQKI
jgi:predicted O-methyltransferase YrrM